jgi:hypothetical protein
MDVFVIDPASVARSHAAFWMALLIVTLVSVVAVVTQGRRAWWVIPFAVLLLPTVATYPFGARPQWSFSYLPDVVLPLALVVGVPGALLGTGIGALMRRWLGVGARAT